MISNATNTPFYFNSLVSTTINSQNSYTIKHLFDTWLALQVSMCLALSIKTNNPLRTRFSVLKVVVSQSWRWSFMSNFSAHLINFTPFNHYLHLLLVSTNFNGPTKPLSSWLHWANLDMVHRTLLNASFWFLFVTCNNRE